MTQSDDFTFLSALQGYLIADDDSSEPGYTGYQNKVGEWYIMKKTTSGATVSYLYAKGSSSYATNWTARAGLTYALPAVCFA